MFENFSCPCVHAPAGFFEQVIDAYVRESFGHVMARATPSLTAAVGESIDFGGGRSEGIQGWRPEIGYLNSLSRRPGADPSIAVAQLVLCALEAGAACKLRLTVDSTDALHFAGYRLFVTGPALFNSDGQILLIEHNRNVQVFERTERQWRKRDDKPGSSSRRTTTHGVVVLAGDQIDPEVSTDADSLLPAQLFPEMVAMTAQSLEILGSASALYTGWCLRVLRQIHVVQSADPKVTVSRSTPIRPGSIVLSHTRDLMTYLEGMVHECSHQYYYMARMLTAIRRDRDDETLYYSSIVSRHRTIDRILLAYHATANILLCLHEVRSASREWSEAANRRFDLQRPICRQLLDTLIAHADRLSHNANRMWQGSQPYIEPILGLN